MYGRNNYEPTGGSQYLAKIHGTEEDKVNCPFYYKIGACRHGERCSRVHNKPTFSQTVIIPHMWNSPEAAVMLSGGDPSILKKDELQDEVFKKRKRDCEMKDIFDDFYDEVFNEVKQFGKIEELQVCENLGEHLLGNVYVKFEDEEEAEKCLTNFYGRYFAGRQMVCEYSPVTDFKEARCRQYDEGVCSRGKGGGYCNFMHVKSVSPILRKHLIKKHKYGKMSSDLERTRGWMNERDGGGRGRGGDGGGRRYGDRYGDRRRDDRYGGGGRRDDRGRYDDRGRDGDRRERRRDDSRERRRDGGSRDRGDRRRRRSRS